jgi:hypothetical protein
MDEKRAMGLTIDEIGFMIDSIVKCKDDNSPVKKKAEGGGFLNAFKKGSELLRSDKTFMNAFKAQ